MSGAGSLVAFVSWPPWLPAYARRCLVVVDAKAGVRPRGDVVFRARWSWLLG